MKKTLIALMALAGVACGVSVTGSNVTIYNTEKVGIDMVVTSSHGLDIDYATYPNTTINTIDDNVSAWAVHYKETPSTIGTENASLTLNIKETLALGGNLTTGTHSTFRTSIVTTITDEELAALATKGTVSRWITTQGHISNFDVDKVSLTLNGLSGYADGGYVLERGGKYYNIDDVDFAANGAMTINGETIRQANLEARTYYTVIKMNTDETAGAGIKSFGFVVVPEPATATLSLPALAGLAAHRRRH